MNKRVARTDMTRGLIVSHALSAVLLGLMISCSRSFKDPRDAMAFYGVYHQSPGNQFIHFLGVPCIIFTVLLFQSHLRIVRSVTWATLTSLFYFIFYLSIDPIGASLYAPVLYLMHWAAQMLVDFDQDDFRLGAEEMAYRNKKRNDDAAADGKETHDTADSATATEAEAVAPSSPVYIPWTGTGRMLNYAFGLHLLAWYAQIHPGHFVMEGAKPALATSLGDALTTAPLFAFYEGLWFIGLRKEFQKEVLQLVKVKTRDLCRTGERMRICETVKWTEAMDERQDVNKMGMLLN